MKRALVFLGGIIEDYSKYDDIDSKKFDIYCADGGAEHAANLKLIPELIIGDFDSISESTIDYFKEQSKFIKYPSEKDFTDGELLIEKIYDLYEEIIVLGALGGSNHHLLGNIFLIEKFPNIRLLGDSEEIFFLKKINVFFEKKDYNISFIPIDKSNVLSLNGFKYNLDKKCIKRGETLTLSNTIISDNACAEVHYGSFIGIIKREKFKI